MRELSIDCEAYGLIGVRDFGNSINIDIDNPYEGFGTAGLSKAEAKKLYDFLGEFLLDAEFCVMCGDEFKDGHRCKCSRCGSRDHTIINCGEPA